MTTKINDVIAEAIAASIQNANDMKRAAIAAAEAFAAGEHAYSNWKPEGKIVDTLVVKLVLDTSDAEAAITALEKRAAALKSIEAKPGNQDSVAVRPVKCVEAARKWADQVLTDVSQGLPMPPLPELLLTLAAIGQGRQ